MRVVEAGPPKKETRIIIYVPRELKEKWYIYKTIAGCRDNHEFMVKLLELYELVSMYVGEKKIDEVLRRVGEILGIAVRLRIVEPPRQNAS